MIVLLLACASTGTDTAGPATDSAPDSGDTGVDSGETGDAGDEPVVVDTVTDVIVVGSGPAGVAAAMAATDAGANVILFERDDVPGTGMRLAGSAYAVNTEWQAEIGVVDSTELAESEWFDTTGEAGDQPSVKAYIENSAATLEWLEAHGFQVGPPIAPPTEGSVARSHVFMWPQEESPYYVVMGSWSGELRTEVEVTAPLMENGSIVGVKWHNLVTGEEGATGAAAVVLASGGFLRDLDAVAEVRPDLAAHDPIFETNLNSVGSTLPFLVEVGAAREAPEQVGAYLHSIEDPIRPGEALILQHVGRYVLVGPDAKRFTADVNLSAFEPANEAPPGDLWLISSGNEVVGGTLSPPGYNWAVSNEPESLSFDEVVEEGSEDVYVADTLSDLATMTGLATALVREIEAFNADADLGIVDEFGRLLSPGDALKGNPWLALRLKPGLAKNFGGVATDMNSHVLDAAGQVIPGLYAAGEVAGMIPGGGSGKGFSGSASACYYGGRLAGENAAGDAAVQ